MDKTTEDKILFSWVVAITAIIRITPTSTWVQDSDGTSRTFPGGTNEYKIDVEQTKTTTGKKAKSKGKTQSITIRKKLPLCPISGLPIELNKEFVFKEGFALNEHSIRFHKHYAFELNPAYYCKIGHTHTGDIYAMSKIVDGRKMDIIARNALTATLNCDIAELIVEKFEVMNKDKFNFKMVESEIVPGQMYHRNAIRKMVDTGLLDIGFVGYDYELSSITMLTCESWHHIYPKQKTSILKDYFDSVDSMMESKRKIIEKCL